MEPSTAAPSTPASPSSYEKLGLFYLGRPVDPTTLQTSAEPYLLDSRHLLTHGVILGMTGSGKTGLAVSLLEEAAIDGIPAIAIDPKGDLSNLLLTFPNLAASDFAPFVDPDEAARSGVTVEALAEKTAARWQKGLAEWDQSGERIARLRSAATVTVYTPGSTAGVQLAVLRPLAAPPESLRNDAELLRERIGGAVASLLGLLGVDADPMRSREHILLSAIVEAEWQKGKDLDLPRLIPLVQRPPVDRVGVLDLESFFPSKDRGALALQLNALYASPLYKTWAEGEPLDVGKLLFGQGGKPRLSVLSIAHLSDEQRMFFVATLLGEVVAWMRQQSGTSSLRALVYMDEIFGYFPPTANPPSKGPMLTLLKQARAFGLGIVLATQNPVDLDYKALGNAGTWMVGRLQQERDRLRLLDGLEGAAAAAGRSFDRAKLERLLASLESRVFLINDVHADGPVLVRSRWAMSYLRGPLTRELLQRAQAPTRSAPPPVPASGSASPSLGTSPTTTTAAPAAATPTQPAASPVRPPVPAEIKEIFVRQPGEQKAVVRPFVAARLRLHFVDKKLGLDEWRRLTLLTAVGTGLAECNWDEAAELSADHEIVDQIPDGVAFAPVAAAALQPKRYAKWEKDCKAHAYAHRRCKILFAPGSGLAGRPGEGEDELRARLALQGREQRDAAIAAVQKKYAPKLAALETKLQAARAKLVREQSEVRTETIDTALTMGAGILGALLGKKVASAANVGRVRSAAKAANRTQKQRGDVALAEQKLAALQAQKAELEAEIKAALGAIDAQTDAAKQPLETIEVAPKKADITVEGVYLAWG